jgi:glycosyltransferase involved in cell wall biosynthesis
MRILHISSAKSFGEHEHHIVDLSRGLMERGHVVFAALRPTSDWQERLDFLPPENILRVSIRNSFGILSSRRIADFVRENEIEIVHAHIPRDYIPASLACTISKSARFVLTRHAPAPLRPFNRFALKNLTRAVAVSSASEASLRRLFPPEKIAAIHNGVDPRRLDRLDLPELRERFRSEHSIPLSVPLVGITDELSEAGGVRDLVVAALEVLKPAPNTRFLIVGLDNSPGRSFRRELRRLTRAFQVEENFVWLNSVSEAEFFAAIDIFVSVPHQESSGLSILEAMSHSKAVVALNTEGVPELLGMSELLAAPGDAGDLAAKIARLAADDEIRASIAEELRRRALEKYSLERMIDATEEMYASILAAS